MKKIEPIIEGKVKGNVKKFTGKGRQCAPPPPPPDRILKEGGPVVPPKSYKG